MRQPAALAALTVACLLAAGCGAAHRNSTAGRGPEATGRPIVQSPSALRSDEASRKYGSADAVTVGDVLTTTRGSRAGGRTRYAYQWQDCNSRGADCTNITGAASPQYTVRASDVGNRLRAMVTATGTAGVTPTHSAVTGLVAPKAPGAANVANFNITDDSDAVTVANAGRYQIVQLQYSSTVKTLVDAIHAAHPRVTVLMYSDPTVAGSGQPGTDGWTSCTKSTQDAGQNAWYLWDHGLRISSHMNLGDADYDAACVSTAMARARSADFDGIFWDEINPVPGYAISQTCINAYQAAGCSLYNGNGDYTAWQNNTLVLLKQIAAYDRANGVTSIINDGSGTSAQWDAWGGLAGITGQMEESCIGFADARAVPYSQWQIELADMLWSESHHKYALCLHYDDGQDQESPDTYGLASMLLAANGYSSYNSTVTRLDRGSFQWWPEYTIAQNLGAPTSGYTTVRSGSATVYERRFANGIVVVNPTGASSGTVPLGGTYAGTGNEPTQVSSVTLRPQTGLILTRGP